MKKILIVGPDFFGYNDSINRGFQKLGYQTHVYSYIDGYKGFSNKILCDLLSTFKINYFKKKYDKKINDNILNEIEKFQPNFILFIKPEKIFSETLKNIKIPKILWMMDSVFRYNNIIKDIWAYDFKYMFEEDDVVRLEQKGINSVFLPLAFDEDIYYPIEQVNKDIDLLFIGSLYSQRINFLEEIIKEFPYLNIEIYGKYTSLRKPFSYIKYNFSKYKKYFKNYTVSPQEVNKLYSRSKICLNIHHSQSNKGCNPRFFEISASRAFQLVDDNQFILNHYAPYINCFGSLAELKELIEKYVNEPELREKKTKGYEYITNNNSFLDRVKIIDQHLMKG